MSRTDPGRTNPARTDAARTGAAPGAGAAEPMLPVPYRVASRTRETHDSVTLSLEPAGPPLPPFQPGQFTMLAVPGIGEVAISVSGDPAARDGRLVHTVRAVGAVTRALYAAPPGRVIGVRGPFGTSWDLPSAAGRDLIFVAGGVGLAPLRPRRCWARSPRGAATAGSASSRGPASRPSSCSAASWPPGPAAKTWRWS